MGIFFVSFCFVFNFLFKCMQKSACIKSMHGGSLTVV